MSFVPEELFDLLKNEKRSGELASLNKTFYKEAEEYIRTVPDQTEKQNLTKTLNMIKERRTQKLLIYLTYNKNLPLPSPSEEEDLYNQIKRILTKETPTARKTQVRILAQLPEIITTKGNRLGPFKQNEIVEVEDSEDLKFVVSNKIGEIVQ